MASRFVMVGVKCRRGQITPYQTCGHVTVTMYFTTKRGDSPSARDHHEMAVRPQKRVPAHVPSLRTWQSVV